ncbi:hypothetical protein J2T16_003581 [Paenibacillus intestini]|uniref:hypothetical protein n=1 Tax=Paenibacillus TaxID=44249 RepID=UPI001C8D8627|nr:hypothetical protein [Paenibacillus cucumis (ex Kampfer et al. 2016)]MDP9700674.1 hypothetical protein [Paenibacillus intestini]
MTNKSKALEVIQTAVSPVLCKQQSAWYDSSSILNQNQPAGLWVAKFLTITGNAI